jgi:hypothetical protein
MESGRATEGIRVALGLVSGGHRVEVILIDGAMRLLGPDAEEGVDGDLGQKFLATLREWIPHFAIEATSAGAFPKGENRCAPLSPEEMATRIAAADRFIIF